MPQLDTTTIRVLCVDDHNIVLDGLKLIIERHLDLKVVASARNGQEAIELFQRHRPDVTLMDLRLPVVDGLDAIGIIKSKAPEARIIVLTTYDDDEDIFRALQAGATTYLLKDTLSNDLVRTIRAVHNGTATLEATIRTHLTERAGRPALTAREIEVMTLIAQGMRNKEIAAVLGITGETVASHIKNIFFKLEVQDRTAAVHIALRRGIIRPPNGGSGR